MLALSNLLIFVGLLNNIEILEKHDRCYYAKTGKGYMDSKEIALDYISSFIGVPYKWGGDDFDSMDCSGIVNEYLKCLGIIVEQQDFRALEIWKLLKDRRVKSPERGNLVFYWKTTFENITHVEILLNNELYIGAMGGGPSIINREKAMEKNAFVKVRKFINKVNIAGYVNPFLKVD